MLGVAVVDANRCIFDGLLFAAINVAILLLVIRHRHTYSTAPKHAIEEQTMYQRVGVDTIRVVVEQLYRRIVADPWLSPHFEAMSLDHMTQLKRHQALLIGQLLGGPVYYEMEDLKRCHQHLNVGNDAYARVVGHLLGVLYGLRVAPDIITHLFVQVERARPLIVAEED